MTEQIEVRETVRVFVRSLDEAPESVDLHLADSSDPGEYYYEVSLADLGDKLGKRYVKYDGPEGAGFFDTARKELHTRSVDTSSETSVNRVKNELFKRADAILEKYKVYISDADTMDEAQQMAPDWADVQQSDRGAFYYEKLPGQGAGEEQEYETGTYEVDTQFGEILADRVNNDEVGDIPVDDLYEYLDEVDDEELIADALLAEIEGANRKTGRQFIEKRADELGIDIDSLLKDNGPGESLNFDVTSLSEVEMSPEDFSDEVLEFSEEYMDETWTPRELYEELVVKQNQDTGIPTGYVDDLLAEAGSEELAYAVWDVGAVPRFVKQNVRNRFAGDYNVYFEVESIPSEYRFDPTEMDANTPEQWFASALEQGNEGKGEGPGSSLKNWVPSDDKIEAIDNPGVLKKAKGWADEGELHPELEQKIDERLNELDPPDPSDYDLDEGVFNRLHDSRWPDFDTTPMSSEPGKGVEDLSDVYGDTSTDDLKKYRELCEDRGFDARTRVVDGMLWYRDDGDVKTEDLFGFNDVTPDDYDAADIDAVKTSAEETLQRMDPHAGAQLSAYIEEFELQEPGSGSDQGGWAGQAQKNGRKMAIDAPFDVEKTTSHEMGHAFHYAMGVKSTGYGTIDNRDRSRDDWEFGSTLVDGANENAKDFYNDIREEWDKYVDQEEDVNEIRPYQKRHGAEIMAVGFAHWSTDEFKIRNRHPGLAEVFDKHVGDGVKEVIPHSEVEIGDYVEVETSDGKTGVVEVENVFGTAEDFKVTGVSGGVSSGVYSPNDFNVTGFAEEYDLEIEEGKEFTITNYDDPDKADTIRIGEVLSGGDSFWIEDEDGNQIDVWDRSQLADRLYEEDTGADTGTDETQAVSYEDVEVDETYESPEQGVIVEVTEPPQEIEGEYWVWAKPEGQDFADRFRVSELRRT
jgi:hypothetical protein